MDLLRQGSEAAKAEAAGALGNLADSDAGAVLVREAGAIPLLVDLLQEGSEEAKRIAAPALDWIWTDLHGFARICTDLRGFA